MFCLNSMEKMSCRVMPRSVLRISLFGLGCACALQKGDDLGEGCGEYVWVDLFKRWMYPQGNFSRRSGQKVFYLVAQSLPQRKDLQRSNLIDTFLKVKSCLIPFRSLIFWNLTCPTPVVQAFGNIPHQLVLLFLLDHEEKCGLLCPFRASCTRRSFRQSYKPGLQFLFMDVLSL